MKTFTRPAFYSLLVLIFLMGTAHAQSAADSVAIKPVSQVKDTLILVRDSSLNKKDPPKKSHLEAGMDYQNNDVYLGRKDSTVLPYFIPSVGYYHKSGLYATASLNYLKNATESRIDLVTLEAGYLFSAGNYDGQFSTSKYFYSSQSTSVTSELTGSFAYENSYDLGFIKPTLTGTLNIGSKTDFTAYFGLEHEFTLPGDQLDFTPAIAANASTQNYYNDYYKKRRYIIRKGQKLQSGVARITGTVLEASAFKLLDYELSLSVNYRIGKCTIHFTPTYSIPVNPAKVAIQAVMNNGTVINKTRTEKIENTFYWTAGVSVSL